MVKQKDLSFDKSTAHYPEYCYDGYYCDRYQSSNAVDRVNSTCTRNRPIGRYRYESVWWRVDLGDIYNVYNVIILFKDYGEARVSRQRGRFAGFSIYLSNSTRKEAGIMCYKNGQELPPLEFTTTCTGLGRYVFFYNERLRNVTYPDGYETYTYTELCEVIVQGKYIFEALIYLVILHINFEFYFITYLGCTRTGFYGDKCRLRCPENCLERKCNIGNGTCMDCNIGWTGKFCRERCHFGSYGVECQSMCAGFCKDNVSCNHVTGGCDDGCAAGWSGTFCEKECDVGKYGPNCIHSCSGYCMDGTPCNRENGRCETGCIPGYMGDVCDQKCPPGSYGINCQYRCSGHCHNDEICNGYDGSCSRGCQEPYVGLACDFYHDTSTSASTIALAVLVSLIGTTLICVGTMLLRKKYGKTPEKVNEPVKEVRVNETFSTAETSVKDEPQSYEEVNVSENWNAYQDLNAPDIMNAYQNLEFAA
ncbi:multiple epidermal growth factor-like domains protein 10 isoform X2 [Ostrea edulis]|uniref:multiple epidermal growth factor-like domains protein 10 isoform X2 n=1 Tax=Ostrea edulis TaxID=37623 RepID=UPI0024AF0234|nr:multiple epidermal growth factor-like domains protein 10 isoform X2 [Ostrea edulis]